MSNNSAAIAMAPVASPILEVAFSDEQGGPLSFTDKQDLIDWIKAEVNLWSWIQQPIGPDPHITNFSNPIKQALQNLQGAVARSGGNAENLAVQEIKNFFEVWRNSGFMHSGASLAQIIFKINEKYDTWAAQAALAHSRSSTVLLQYNQAFIGVLQYHLLTQGVTMESNAVLIDAFERTQRDAANKLSKLNTQAENLIGTVKTDADAEIEKMHQIQKTYTEHMNLAAPVEYWSEKANEHETKRKKAEEILFNYGIGAPIGFLIIAFLAVWLTPANNMHILLALGIFASTVLFWIGRILVRLYLSEVHLVMDAKQRVTMIKTYLALKKDSAVEKTERELVLKPLFTPTSDGIVKDDGAPLFSLSSLLSAGK